MTVKDKSYGKTGYKKSSDAYYVQITRYFEPYMEDSEDYEEPFCGWHCKRKIKIE